MGAAGRILSDADRSHSGNPFFRINDPQESAIFPADPDLGKLQGGDTDGMDP
jgi:hypothetical protein